MLPIGSSFQNALGKLNNEDKGRVVTFMMKFYEDPAHPSISLERVQQAKCPELWSGRVSKELRAILHKDGDAWVAVYVGHHEDAYDWAGRYLPGRHPKTGAWQIVEMPIISASASPATPSKNAGLFASRSGDYLLSLGVPELWLPTIRQIATEDELLEVAAKLPSDVSERLLDLAAGKLVTPPVPLSPTASLAESEESSPNLIIVRSKDELRFLLDAPLAKWIAFLHPTQKKLAQGSFNGAVKVTGSAGTGKTVVAMHRAKYLAAQGQRVLITSFVQTLCRNIERNLQLFCTAEELRCITVTNVHKLAADLLIQAGESWQPLNSEQIETRLKESSAHTNCPLDADNLFVEWQAIIETQGITSWEQYRSASRAGRGRALTVKDRKAVWEVVERVQQQMLQRHEVSFAGLCRRAAELIKAGRIVSQFDAVIVDETQDLQAQELLMLATLTPHHNLMLVGDGGQRIYAGKSSLKSQGIDVRGRSHVLRLNYRTTEQIRRFADNLLASEADDLDGNRESRAGTRSLLSGPEPVLNGFDSRPAQNDFILERIQQLLQQGHTPDEIAVFARQAKLLDQIETRLKRAGIPNYRLSKDEFPPDPMVNLGTMHRAKGLEFKVVFVIDADDATLPSAGLLRKKTDGQVRDDFIEQEQQLLYVSITRARDAVFVTWAGEPSRFLKSSV